MVEVADKSEVTEQFHFSNARINVINLSLVRWTNFIVEKTKEMNFTIFLVSFGIDKSKARKGS